MLNLIEPIEDLHIDPEASLDSTDLSESLAVIDLGHNIASNVQDTTMENIIGTPEVYEDFYDRQDLPYNCTVAVQHCILKAFGIDVSEAELTELAMRKGWLTEEGGNLLNLGKVLEYYGIDTQVCVNLSLDNLIVELEHGRAVMVIVDSGELWKRGFLGETWEWFEDIFGGDPDHVVWITGVDLSDPNNPQVIINDTGHPDGAGQRYPLSTFVDAWEDGCCIYVKTSEAPPDYESYRERENELRHV